MASQASPERVREQVRKVLAGRTSVTPLEVFVALGLPRDYDAQTAEAVCGHLAALGFALRDGGTWSQEGVSR